MRHEVGVMWPGRNPGAFSIQFQDSDDTSGRTPKMAFDKARALSRDKRGFIDAYANEPRQGGNGGGNNDGYGGRDFGSGEDF